MLDYDNDDVDLEWDDEDDFVTVRPGGFRIVRAVVAIVVLVAIGWYLYSGIRGWFEAQLDPVGEPGEAVQIVIPSRATTGDIAQILETEGVVPNSTFFRYYTEWKNDGNFQAGEYSMQLNSSVDEAIATLKLGPIPPVFNTFGVPEGLWLDEMLPRLAEQLPTISEADLRAVLDSGQLQPRYRPEGQTSWEGLLFPAFYEVEDDAEPIEVLAKMNDEFSRVTGELGYGAAETQLDMSAYDVIIVASMVEAEAKTEGDRPKIARVIYNRLREQMSIDIDATCIYGSGDRRIELTRDFMEVGAGQYACRKHSSLPPTPISAPGRASLEAAINPAEGDWLYYVLADEEGNHFFTADFDEFNQQKAIAQEKGLF
ncbi:MAG: endolytic transglycosylase MltG [Acidimicrobiales bacterium]